MEYKYEVVCQKATNEKSLTIASSFEEAKRVMLVEMMRDAELCGTLSIHKRKVYTIIRRSRLGGTTKQKGCLKELVKHYSNLLSYWHHATPKTINKLVDALNQCVSIQQGGCYNRDHYEKGEEN